ncbi:MAG: YveK family protein [Catenisphaera adipataccumulans]|jgi:capsular polysaccharide biosynthesis protein|uniref:YveK family protein n=1 Tax=Catenisphaera adipataccumulans TaxID=700500 RepID=UPI003D907CC2
MDQTNTEEMNFDIYWKTFTKHLKKCFVIIVLTVLIVCGYGKFIKHQTYECDVLLHAKYINSSNKTMTSDELDAVHYVLNDAQYDITSNEVINEASQNLDISKADIKESISVTHDTNSNYIKISIKTENAKKSYQIAKEISSDYIEYSNKNNGLNLSISQKAELNNEVVSPNMKVYFLFSLVLGIFISIAYVVYLANREN